MLIDKLLLYHTFLYIGYKILYLKYMKFSSVTMKCMFSVIFHQEAVSKQVFGYLQEM